MTPSNEQINDWLKAAEASPEPRFLIFATLATEWGAKEEREACAKVCDAKAERNFPWSSENADKYHAQADWANVCAEAIRARGQENKS